MINDKPHWYTTEYLNRFNVQLLTESDKSEAEKDTVIFHGPFKTVEEAIEFEKEVPYCTWTWEEEGTWNTSSKILGLKPRRSTTAFPDL